MKAGIQVIEQEESFTSRADISASDFMPGYGWDKGTSCVFSGSRVKRSLYRTHTGHLINADCNGATNILRKAVPDAWEGISDFRFLGFPESFSYKRIIGTAH
jgi:putative transposase